MSTQQQQLQMQNKQLKRSKSDGGKVQKKRQSLYRGVRSRKQGRWVSEIRMPDKRGRIWLGSYDSAYKAALAYDFAAFCLRGRRSKLNFPNSLPYLALEFGIPTSPRSIQVAASQFAEEQSSSSGYAVESEPVAAVAVERPKMLVAATISEGRSIGSSNDDDDNSMGFEAISNKSREQLPALDLDFGVLDSLSRFLASHSHTDWWLG